jgi:hypothetical protein
MKIGFDYWNVISHYPHQMALLSNAASRKEDIHVISAIGKNRVDTIVGDVKKLWPSIDEKNIHGVVFKSSKESPELKLAKCKELGIQIFLDDRQDVCDLLNANGILALKVPRKENKTDIEAERK